MSTWEEYQERIKTAPYGGWAKLDPGQTTDDVPSIHIGPMPGRKRPALYILEKVDGVLTQTPLAYFRDEASSRVAIGMLNEFFLDRNSTEET